jgi:hypothetical protein
VVAALAPGDLQMARTEISAVQRFTDNWIVAHR